MARRGRSPYSSDDEFNGDRKRFKKDNVKEELVDLIYHLGDKDLIHLLRDLETVATIIKRDSSIIKRKILDILVNCAKNIPEKITIYVTLIGIINTKDYSFVEEFVELLLTHFKDAIKMGNHEDTKFLLRFISDLINAGVIPPSSVMVLYNVLIGLALEDSTPRLCSDWLVYMVLYALPWSALKLAQNCKNDLDTMMQNIETYVSSSRQLDHLDILQVWTSNEHQPQEDYIDCLWEQIKQMQSEGWRERVLWRLYKDPKITNILQQSRSHNLPQMSLTLSSSVYPLPMIIFRLFDYTDIQIEPTPSKTSKSAGTIPSLSKDNNQENEAKGEMKMDVDESEKVNVSDDDGDETKPILKELILPGSHSIERFLVEEQYRILIDGFKTNRKICAKALLALPIRVELPTSYMIVETILGEMFKLPRPVQSLIYYNSLLMDLCREASNEIPLVLAQATEMLFDRIDTMRVSCIERLVKWFSHHLSNFKYQWSWSDWSYCCTNEDFNNLQPKPRFIMEVLERLLRLSFYDHLKVIIPKDLSRLMPKPPGSVNKYGEGAPKDLACQKLCQQVISLLKSGSNSKELISFLQSIADSRYDLEKYNYGSLNSPKLEEDDNKDLVLETKQEPTEYIEETIQDNDEETDKKDDLSKFDGDSGVDDDEKKVEDLVDDEDDEKIGEDDVDMKDDDEKKVEIKVETALEDEGLYPGVSRRVIDVFMTALLTVSNKTFTHSFLYLEKFKDVIMEFVNSPRDEVELLHSLYGCWQEQQQYVVVLVQRLQELGIVTPRSVICWIFSDELQKSIPCFYIFEIIESIMNIASYQENTAWLLYQEAEESMVDDNEQQKNHTKKEYAKARKNYMDLVKSTLAGLICRLNKVSTSKLKDPTVKLDLVELLTDFSSQPKQEETEDDAADKAGENKDLTKDLQYWLLGRIENLLLSVDLPHNYLLKSLDEFFKSVQVPDEVLEIYGTFRSTINQSG